MYRHFRVGPAQSRGAKRPLIPMKIGMTWQKGRAAQPVRPKTTAGQAVPPYL